ncbi:MAG: hypothetical protein B7X55_10805 [Rhodobacterales bacterium 34-62-10]|nr:MAG: hypothetical protein B7X55_10805 [Rhodobacterales bacterium 34-62-10]
MTYGRYIRLLTALTAAIYLLMLGIGAIWLVPASGGMLPPDTWITGYDAARMTNWMMALEEPALALYMGPLHWLDTLFPPLLGLLLASIIWRLGRGWLAMVPFLYSATDLWENAVLRGIVSRGDVSLADHAAALTQGKFALLGLALALLWMVWRDYRRNGPLY